MEFFPHTISEALPSTCHHVEDGAHNTQLKERYCLRKRIYPFIGPRKSTMPFSKGENFDSHTNNDIVFHAAVVS